MTARRTHAVLTVLWVVLIPPSVLLWRNSIPYLVAVSVYANLASHWSAWQASRAEEAAKEERDGQGSSG